MSQQTTPAITIPPVTRSSNCSHSGAYTHSTPTSTVSHAWHMCSTWQSLMSCQLSPKSQLLRRHLQSGNMIQHYLETMSWAIPWMLLLQSVHLQSRYFRFPHFVDLWTDIRCRFNVQVNASSIFNLSNAISASKLHSQFHCTAMFAGVQLIAC